MGARSGRSAIARPTALDGSMVWAATAAMWWTSGRDSVCVIGRSRSWLAISPVPDARTCPAGRADATFLQPSLCLGRRVDPDGGGRRETYPRQATRELLGRPRVLYG